MGKLAAMTLQVFDVQLLTDSISLVCSADANFCGAKELVLIDPTGTEVDMLAADALFAYSEENSQLTIDTENLVLEGVYTLKARLVNNLGTDQEFFP
jgi:hypothetical protein